MPNQSHLTPYIVSGGPGLSANYLVMFPGYGPPFAEFKNMSDAGQCLQWVNDHKGEYSRHLDIDALADVMWYGYDSEFPDTRPQVPLFEAGMDREGIFVNLPDDGGCSMGDTKAKSLADSLYRALGFAPLDGE